MITTKEIEISGKSVRFEVGRVAKQAGGAVVVSCGGTVVLAVSTMGEESSEPMNFFPLTVAYSEKMYAAGKIPGGFFKRGGRPSEKETLSSRLIDRALRPLFPGHFRRPVQIIAYVLSSGGEISPEILALSAASAASLISDEPFTEAVGAVKVGFIDGKFVVNPSEKELKESDLSLSIAGTKDALLMVEAEANEISEDQMTAAIKFAIPEIKKLALIQEDLREAVGKEKITVAEITVDESLKEAIAPLFLSKIEAALQSTEKLQREKALDDIKEEIIKKELEENPEKETDINYIFDELLEKYLRKRTLEGIRVDGRKFSEIRDISIEVGLLKHTHGSGLFTRGQTQVLSIATLGAQGAGQLIESLEPEFKKRYMHYYNFPSFSVGEVRPMRGPSRREIGHGALAERALLPVLPSEEEFPYTIRVISEVLESNGSSSMASTCGSTLALMDAGVPIKKAVAGIAMGLVTEGERYAILTDIQGAEDHFGDMDFKVTGTKDGITALQMDIKLKGIKLEILKEALNQAKDARLFILEKMLSVLSRPREEISPYAPRIFTLKINPDKIGLLIGPGGKTIKGIIGETESDVNIEPDGTVYISAPDGEIGEQIRAQIIGLLEEPEVNKIYTGKVVDIKDFGAFVQILPNSVGLLHVSQLSDKFVKDIRKEIKVGDEVKVRVMKVEGNGKIQLTRKGLEENSSQKRNDKK